MVTFRKAFLLIILVTSLLMVQGCWESDKSLIDKGEYIFETNFIKYVLVPRSDFEFEESPTISLFKWEPLEEYFYFYNKDDKSFQKDNKWKFKRLTSSLSFWENEKFLAQNYSSKTNKFYFVILEKLEDRWVVYEKQIFSKSSLDETVSSIEEITNEFDKRNITIRGYIYELKSDEFDQEVVRLLNKRIEKD